MAHPQVSPIEATNRLILSALHAKPKEDSIGKFIGLCPVHETLQSNPSLLIYENASGYLGFTCLSKKCEHNKIVTAIKTKFGLTVPYAAKKVDSGGQVNKIINYPAHESSLPLKYRKAGDTLYEYHCETGEVAFIVQRWVNADGKKDIRPFFSKTYVSEDGISQKDWDPTDPPKKDRPLYNLFSLYQKSSGSVLIVEGEKAAEAAKRIPELKDFVITTWSGGTSAHSFTNWKPLKERDTSIYFWPDNDAAGTKAMREILAKLSKGFKDSRFYILDYKKLGVHEVAQGWDIADESAGPECPYSIEEMIAGFEPYTTEEILETGTLDEELARLEAEISLVNLGGKIHYVELNHPIDDRILPYYHWNSLADLKAERNKQIKNDEEKLISTVITWANNPSKPAFEGLIFKPDINDKIVKTSTGKKINIFTGFPDFGAATNTMLIELFNEYMEKILPEVSERNWLIDQMRLSVQRPAVKPGNAIVLIGRQGTGKSTFYRVWSSILGINNCAYLGAGLDSQFNDVLSKALLIGWDEFEINHHRDVKQYNTLKTWITEPRISVNGKNKPMIELDSYHRFVFTSNSLRPISLPPEDRRFFITSITDALKGNDSFWTRLYSIIDPEHTYAKPMVESERLAALAGFAQWLRETAITSNVMKVIQTSAKEDMATPNSAVLSMFKDMYNDQELPSVITEFMDPLESAKFGKEPIKLPQQRFLEAIRTKYGRNHMEAMEVKLLKKYFMETASNKLDSKTYSLRYVENNAMVVKSGKAYILPPIEEGRRILEEMLGIYLKWEPLVSAPEDDADRTNVVELAKKDVL